LYALAVQHLYLVQQEDPYLEELMAEWQAVNKSADKLATAVHRMASTVAQVRCMVLL
jgi:hypothetical protein